MKVKEKESNPIGKRSLDIILSNGYNSINIQKVLVKSSGSRNHHHPAGA
jgi:hypothetical protein